MATSKTYSIQDDFNVDEVDAGILDADIRASGITVALDGVSLSDDDVSVSFKAELDSSNEDLLDAVVAAYSGTAGVSSAGTVEVVLKGTPRELDGRINIVNAPMSNGQYSWWTGAGDIPADEVPPEKGPISGRGEGEELTLHFSGAGEQVKVISFSSYVEVYDGEGNWSPTQWWDGSDKFWIYALIPANQPACEDRSATMDGNATVVNTGQGFSMLVPAGGQGEVEIDLEKAAPLETGPGHPLTYWSMADKIDGTVSVPTTDNPANVALLYDMGWRIYICYRMPMGSPLGVFLVDSDKSEGIHKNWKVVVKVVKLSAHAGEMSVWLKFFRPDTTEPDWPPTVASEDD